MIIPGLINVITTSQLDPDAVAFIDAAGLITTTEKGAINTLVKELKVGNFWNKYLAIYPIIGGSTASHKFNLKDPQDTDAAYRLSFTGGWVHDSTGAKPNGTNATADTHFNPRTVFGPTGTGGFSVYFITATGSTGGIDFGNQDGVNDASWLRMEIGATSTDIELLYPNLPGGGIIGISENDPRGHYLSEWDDTLLTIRLRKVTNSGQTSFGTVQGLTATHVNDNYFISSLGSGSYSANKIGFVGITNYLSGIPTNFFEIVNRFQTALGRNVY